MSSRTPAAETAGVPSLTRICTNVLIRHRDHLENLGWMEVTCLRHVTSHCNAEQLARIEDHTKQGSGRDISWYTWDCWYRIFEQKFGAYRPGSMDIIPLPGTQPPDYVPPAAANAPTADWRRMMERELTNEKQRAAQISNRLRSMYDEAHKEKASRSAEICVIKPPPKRRRLGAGPSSAPAANAPVEKAKAKMLYDIGMSSSALNKKPTSSGSKGGHKVQVTRTVVVHKASSSAASTQASRPVSQPTSRLGGGSSLTAASNRLSSGSAGSRPAATAGSSGSRPGSNASSASVARLSQQSAARSPLQGSASRQAAAPGSTAVGQKRTSDAGPGKGAHATSSQPVKKPVYSSPIAMYKSS